MVYNNQFLIQDKFSTSIRIILQMICLYLLISLPLNSNTYFVATQGQENIYTDIQNDQGSIL